MVAGLIRYQNVLVKFSQLVKTLNSEIGGEKSSMLYSGLIIFLLLKAFKKIVYVAQTT